MKISVSDIYLCLHVVCVIYCVLGTNDTDISSTVSSRPETNRLESMRQRSRFHRINNIRQHILEQLGYSSPPQIDASMKEEILRNLSLSGIPYRAVTQQCYSASCSLPAWIDDELWNDQDTKTLRMFFDILPSEGGSTTVLNATLKLHIKERTACRCFVEENDAYGDDSVRFTVFVSQFLKPLKRRNRVPRMRILDVQMVVVRRDLWISFNVAEAVQEWSQRRRRRHGLEVNVIDSQGFPIDAKAVFGNVDCTLPVDMECQDTSLPVEIQTSLNYTTSPMLEVFTETRPRVEFREKRDTFLLKNQDQDPVPAKESVFSRKLRSLLECGSTNCQKANTKKTNQH